MHVINLAHTIALFMEYFMHFVELCVQRAAIQITDPQVCSCHFISSLAVEQELKELLNHRFLVLSPQSALQLVLTCMGTANN